MVESAGFRIDRLIQRGMIGGLLAPGRVAQKLASQGLRSISPKESRGPAKPMFS